MKQVYSRKLKSSSEKSYKIAVIGGGVAGIVSSYLLQQKHEVTIFEASDYIGGHARSVEVERGIFADTGFLVFNNITYPFFIKFLKQINAFENVNGSEMSFSFTDLDKNLIFAVGRNINPLFYQKKNLYNPQYYRMFRDLFHFRKRALNDLKNNTIGKRTLGEYMAPYSALFRENMVAPTAISVWTLPVEKIWDFPAETYIRFQYNHRYLNGNGWLFSSWYSFQNSSRDYIEAFLNSFKGKVLLKRPVTKVKRFADKIEITNKNGNTAVFDKVVFATHADITLKMLDKPSQDEIRLLSPWKYHKNYAVLHTDNSVMPADKSLWACWNILTENKKNTVTYYLNRVQNLETEEDYFLTFGTEFGIRDDLVLKKVEFDHPEYNFAAIETQKELGKLNGYLNSYFCGSYFGYGFHEDAVKAAVKIGYKFGIDF